VGSLKEKYWRDGVLEYVKRLSKYCSLEIREVKEGKLPENPSRAETEAAKATEGRALLKKIKRGTYTIALEIGGKGFSSEGFAELIKELPLSGKSDLAFIIGGSNGLSEDLLVGADLRLSFSAMTFPHQMMRVILAEQLYRAFKINSNEPYHK
jgi:23S rRNA (pseudouridine1915-N3)-methyltransferase